MFYRKMLLKKVRFYTFMLGYIELISYFCSGIKKNATVFYNETIVCPGLCLASRAVR